ncbi:MAG: hypothetical protein JWR77_1115, partial [Rhizorhabdus sp.]|nr:hypothetical protein [Rhizorhabdus sp.]
MRNTILLMSLPLLLCACEMKVGADEKGNST